MEQNAKKLGFGLMRLPLTDPNDGASVDVELLKTMVDAFLEKGFTYFDTAWMYCGFQSECAIREALVKRHPRDSYTLADKLHAGFLKTKEDRERIFQEQLRKTGVDYFDYYLLHDVGTDHYRRIKNWIASVGWKKRRRRVWRGTSAFPITTTRNCWIAC